MSVLLTSALIILLFVVGRQYWLRRKMNRELKEMHDKLALITEQGTVGKVFMHTSQPSVQQLLVQVNRLLSQNQKVIADNVRTKESLRKMLSNMSHDLRTPLTVILGYVEKLKRDAVMLKEDQIEMIGRLHEKTSLVINLMKQFFDLAKLESRDADFQITRLSINEICLLDYQSMKFVEKTF